MSVRPVFCRVYTPDHSYVTIRSRLSCRVGEILALVREKLQYSEDQPVLPGNLILVAVTSAGGQQTRTSPRPLRDAAVADERLLCFREGGVPSERRGRVHHAGSQHPPVRLRTV